MKETHLDACLCMSPKEIETGQLFQLLITRPSSEASDWSGGHRGRWPDQRHCLAKVKIVRPTI